MLLPFKRISLLQQVFGGLTSFQRRFRMEDRQEPGSRSLRPKEASNQQCGFSVWHDDRADIDSELTSSPPEPMSEGKLMARENVRDTKYYP